MQTVRYRSGIRLAYAVALLALMEHARQSGEDFEYGPLDLSAAEDQGLVISGHDVSGAELALAGIPGLYRSDC